MATTTAARAIREVFDSGRPLAFIRTPEEGRVAQLIAEAASGAPVFSWTATEGLRSGAAEPGSRDPIAALDFVIAHSGPALFHLKDFHEPLISRADVRRRLRDVYAACIGSGKLAVITASAHALPEEVSRDVVVLELRPPDLAELGNLTRAEAPGLDPDAAALALRGLTLDEARFALRRAKGSNIQALLEEKKLLIARTGYIELIQEDCGLDDIGGLGTLKAWLIERRKLFRMRDSLAAEIVPKGLLMMGIPGCGKSACVKAIASCFELPLYRIDMIEIFSGRHGKPEGAFVEACRTMEEMSPAVLWFDEIEMGITTTETAGQQGRLFAFFLTWMQEKAPGLFVAATANRIDLLPAEMIRKGRFDEVFFVDLPTMTEQIDIFKIHLRRRDVDFSGFEFPEIARFTAGWTGAEIEQCVVSAVTKSKLTGQPVTQQDLISIAAKTVPLSRTMKEQISHIRGWAFERAIRASPASAR